MKRDNMTMSLTWKSKALHLPAAPVQVMLVLALILGYPVTAAKADAAEPYRLAAGDRIAIAVFGQVDISGDYLVDGAGNVLLPIVGPIEVGGLTVSESQQRIAKILSDGYFRQPSVSVRVSELRPIYVVGDIRNPGSYPYRHNASALSAIALAGGFGVIEQGQGSATAEFFLADERLRVLESSRRALVVRQARLEAERNGARGFDDPRVPPIAEVDDRAASMVASEREVFETHRQLLEKEVELYRQQKPRLNAEIEATRGQGRAETKQLELIESRLKDYNNLQSKGLGITSTGIELQREQARNQGNIQKVAAYIARLELELGGIDIKIQEAENAFLRRVTAELQETRSKLQDVDAALPTARELRDWRVKRTGLANALGVGTLANTLGVGTADVSIKIIRTLGKEVRTVRANASTLLEPGDVVEVSRLLRRDFTGAGATRGSSRGSTSGGGLTANIVAR